MKLFKNFLFAMITGSDASALEDLNAALVSTSRLEVVIEKKFFYKKMFRFVKYFT